EIAGHLHQPLNSYSTAAGRPQSNCAHAKVAELADAPDLGSGGETHEGSSPSFRTNNLAPIRRVGLFHCAQLASTLTLPNLTSGCAVPKQIAIIAPAKQRTRSRIAGCPQSTSVWKRH